MCIRDSFDFIKNEVKLANDAVAGPALTSLEGYTAGMKGLSDAGILNQTTFSGLASQITATGAALIAQGQDSSTVMLAMKPDLQQIWEMQQKYGFQVDDSTQKMINQGLQSGLIGEQQKDVNNQILDVLMAIGKALGATLPSDMQTFNDAGVTAADNVAKAMGTIPTDINTTLTINGGAASSPAAAAATQPVGSDGLVALSAAAAHLSGASRLDPSDAAWWEWQASIQGAASGGIVTGSGIQYFAGGGNVLPFAAKGIDTIPAMLAPGEAVLNRSATAGLGRDAIRALNGGLRPSNGAGGNVVDFAAMRDEIVALRATLSRQASEQAAASRRLPTQLTVALTSALLQARVGRK